MNARTCLTFNGTAEDAVEHYVSSIPGATKGAVVAPDPSAPAMVVEFSIGDHQFIALNADLGATFTPALSILVECASQAEIDACWAALSADGSGHGGWTQDRFGVTWQIVPAELPAWMAGPNATAVGEAFRAMGKPDYDALEQAARQSAR